MAQNIKINGVTYNSVSSLSIPLDAGGGNAVFPDTSDATATAGDIAEGKTAYIDGSKVTGIKVETLEPFTITVSAILVAPSDGGGGGGGGGGTTTIRSTGQITFDGDEVFVWDIRYLSTTTYVSDFWNDRLMTDFYNETDGIITSKQQDGISNIFSTGFDRGFAVGVYKYFDGIYISDVPSMVSSGSVTLMNAKDQPNNEITVTGVCIV